MSTAERPAVLRSARVDYGLDAPGIVATFAALCAALTIAGVVLLTRSPGARAHRFGSMALWMGTAWGLTAVLMVLSSRVGKLRARDRLLDRLALRGDETVLDVGCGHGLLLLGAAKRLTTGRAIGVDLWSQRDQSSNSAAATLANADAEQVRDRVEVRDGDMRALPLAEASVDVVLSSLAIHNLSSATDRARALAEIVRVLRPNGPIALLDIAHVREYARVLQALGCTIERSALVPTIFPPTRELHARRGEAPHPDRI